VSRFEDSELGLGPEAGAEEREALIALAERLERQRPIPASGFRGAVRRRLLGGSRPRTSSPQRLRALVVAYAGSGFALLAIATLGVGGVGPLSAG
jgi:hypothetical protein